MDYDSSVFFNEKRDERDIVSNVSPLLQPFTHQSFVNHEMIKLLIISDPKKLPDGGQFLQLSIYPHIKLHVQRNAMIRASHDKKSIRADYVEWCEKFMKTFMALPRSISILTAFGNFSDALAQCLVAQGDKAEAIIQYALTTTMSTNRFKQFLLEFHKIDPEERMTSGIWESLLAYSKKKELGLFRFELMLSRGDLEEAAHEALEEFRLAQTSSLQLCFIGNAVNCLIEAKHMPQRNTPLSDNFESILVLAELQKDLCVKILSCGLPHCPDLINDQNAVIEALAILLSQEDSVLYAKIITMFPTHSNLTNVLETLVTGDVDINKIARGVKAIYGNTGIISLISVISMTSYYVKIPEIIMNVIGMKQKETIAKLLVEFDCLTAALALAETDPSLSHIIPLIGIRASNLGDIHLTKRCEEMIISAK